jgi:putative nucleotidyltransferase with HDIG domain
VARAAETQTVPTYFQSQDTRALFQMASALGFKDQYTHGHAHRVAAYTKRLALCLELPMEVVLQITMGGMLHDVGKLALSDAIFSHQKTALTAEMMVEVRNHPLIGAAMLRKANCSSIITEAVLFHHERIDGSGYPFGIKSDAIPLSARIVSIADCFDAMTTDRPYQRRIRRRRAFEILQASAGTNLSPDLVSLFIDDIQHNGMVYGNSPTYADAPALLS